jgi:hypothetical protein
LVDGTEAIPGRANLNFKSCISISSSVRSDFCIKEIIPFSSLKSKIHSSSRVTLFLPIKSYLTDHAMLEFSNCVPPIRKYRILFEWIDSQFSLRVFPVT